MMDAQTVDAIKAALAELELGSQAATIRDYQAIKERFIPAAYDGLIALLAEVERLAAIERAARAVIDVVRAWADYDTDPESDEYMDICDEVIIKTGEMQTALKTEKPPPASK